MSTVRYFRWDDPGAPSLTGQVGSLTNLLRMCLVGTAGVAYGSKPSAGWAEQFVGAAPNIAAFSNSVTEGGSGCVLLINDNAVGGSALAARATVYATMSDIATGVQATGNAWVRKSGTLDSTARKWAVAADARTVWFYGWNNGLGGDSGARACAVLGGGDYQALHGGPSHFVFASPEALQNNGDYNAALVIASTDAGFTVYNPDGISGTLLPALVHLAPLTGGVGGGAYPTGADPVSGDKYFQRHPYIRTGGRLLGRIRGLVFPNHQEFAAPIGELSADVPAALRLRLRAAQFNGTNDTAGIFIDTQGPWL